MLLLVIFVLVAISAIISLHFSLRDYWPQVVELLNGSSQRSARHNSYAVWPTRLCLDEGAITGVPQVLFRRRPKPFVRKQSWRPAGKALPKVSRRLRYAAAPEQVFVLS